MILYKVLWFFFTLPEIVEKAKEEAEFERKWQKKEREKMERKKGYKMNENSTFEDIIKKNCVIRFQLIKEIMRGKQKILMNYGRI